MAYWLLKSEPGVYSIDDLKKDKVTYWDGVRNYQARNYMREMKRGDTVFFYHSNADPTGIVGLAKIAKTAYPDPTQFDKKSPYYDAKATKAEPRWLCPDVKFVRKFLAPVTLTELKAEKKLTGMELLRRGSRLSVQPVSDKEFELILNLTD